MGLQSYKELKVWQQAMKLVENVYETTRGFPRDEQFGLTIQLKRAAISIPSNIAEGQGTGGTKMFLRHLAIARGSLTEVETQVEIAFRQKYLDESKNVELAEKCAEVGKLLNGLIAALNKKLDD